MTALIGLVTLNFDLLTLKRVRVIGRGIGNVRTNLGVSRTFPSRSLTGQHISDGPRDLFTMTFDSGDPGACRRYGSLWTKFEVLRCSHSEDNRYDTLSVSVSIGLVTLTFDF